MQICDQSEPLNALSISMQWKATEYRHSILCIPIRECYLTTTIAITTDFELRDVALDNLLRFEQSGMSSIVVSPSQQAIRTCNRVENDTYQSRSMQCCYVSDVILL